MLDMALKLDGLSTALSSLEELDPDSTRAEWRVAPGVEYGGYVELGTSRTPAQPYLRPAANSVQANVERHVRSSSSLDAAVKSAALAVEQKAKQRAPVDTGSLRNSIAAEPAGR